MKKLIQLFTLSVMAVMLAVPAFAQEPAKSPAAAAASQDDADAKAALYKKYLDNYKTNQQVAYDAAKEYVQKYPDDDPKIIDYLKTFVTKYEAGSQKANCDKLITEKKWAEAFAVCKQIAAGKPDEIQPNLNTAWTGFQMALQNNNANNAEAMTFSTKTIQLIESGKTLEGGKPYAEKDKSEALGWLNYSLYLYNLKSSKKPEAAAFLIKSATPENTIKSNPETYVLLAALYESEFEELRKQYTTNYGGKDETPESKAALENVKVHLDPLMDAIARAIAYGTDPKYAQKRADLKEGLTSYYTFRYGNAEGIDAMIAGVKSKPLPPPPSPNAMTPAAPTTTTSTSTTATGTQTGATTPATTTPSTTTPSTKTPSTTTPSTTTPSTTKPATTTPATTTPGTKPAEKKPATTTPATPKRR
jgi:hypothetical protein